MGSKNKSDAHDPERNSAPATTASAEPAPPSAIAKTSRELLKIAASSRKPIDLSRLVVPQDSGVGAKTKKHFTTIPVRKPDKFTWFQLHPDEEYQIAGAAVISDKSKNETFLVDPLMVDVLARYITPVVLYLGVTTQSDPFLWALKLSLGGEALDDWTASAHEAAEAAKTQWTKLVSNMGINAYEYLTAEGDLGEPEWPDLDFTQIITIAFKGRYITDKSHPAVDRYLGRTR